MTAVIECSQNNHQHKGGQAKTHLGHDSAPGAAGTQAHIGRNLHRRSAGNDLAYRHALSEVTSSDQCAPIKARGMALMMVNGWRKERKAGMSELAWG